MERENIVVRHGHVKIGVTKYGHTQTTSLLCLLRSQALSLSRPPFLSLTSSIQFGDLSATEDDLELLNFLVDLECWDCRWVPRHL